MIKSLILILIFGMIHAKTATIFMNVGSDIKNKIFDAVKDVSDPKSQNYGVYMSHSELVNFVKMSETKFITTYLDKINTLSYNNFGDSIEVYGNTTSISQALHNIPINVQQYIYFIEGVYDVETKKRSRFGKKSSNPDSGYVGRETISRLYNMSMNLQISTQSSIALIEFSDGGFNMSDYYKSLMLNSVNSTTRPIVIGMDIYDGTESSLDVQMSTMVAPNVTMWYVNYDSTQWIASMACNISNMQQPPLVISVSYGWSENDQCSIVSCNNLTSKEYVNLANYHLAKIALRGVTSVIASGDAGAPSRSNEDCNSNMQHVQSEFPSSSPYVISVGGSYVSTNYINIISANKQMANNTPMCQQYYCASGNDLNTVEWNTMDWTTGSGFSMYFNTTYWQSEYVSQYLASNVSFPNMFNKNGRAHPDIILTAHNCPVVTFGSVLSVDGTSCSAPTFAGMIALLNDKRLKEGNPTVGFINPLLYELSELNNMFTNNFTGTTACTERQCCNTQFGFQTKTDLNLKWTSVSGLGSPNFKALYEQF